MKSLTEIQQDLKQIIARSMDEAVSDELFEELETLNQDIGKVINKLDSITKDMWEF